MLIGVVTGSYSSVFVASPILIAYEDLKKKKLPQPAARRATVQAGDAKPAAKSATVQAGNAKPTRSPKKPKKKQPAGQASAGKSVRG
jgi:hypothetical protein